jgi:cyanate permease
MTAWIKPWITLGCVSLMFALVTAATFNSLGVVLPAMIGEMKWSGTAAGTGFSLLGIFCGITSTVPALLIRRVGARATLVLGSLAMGCAFVCLARAHDLTLYFIGCSLAGLGFTLLATVPGTYLLARLFARPSFAFGLYFTLGGLGGVAGPLLYLWVSGITNGWRDYWLAMAAIVTLAGLISAALVDTKTDAGATEEKDPDITQGRWTARAAMKTPQFAILAAAYSIFLFVGITVNSWSVTHLASHGVSVAMAGGMISIEALLSAGVRFVGGVAIRFIDARKMLLLSLALLIVGLLALSVARDTPLLMVYAAGIGIGYGLTFFASTILLLDYFGRGPNLELFAAVNLISTVGSGGPAFAGYVADASGSFVPAFLLLAAMTLAVLVAVALMRPPRDAVA